LLHRSDQTMEPRTAGESRMIRYLLGDLSPAEMTRLEEQFINDDACYQQLLGVEEALIEAYVRNELSETDRQRFEQYFMRSPRQRERVKDLRALMRIVAEERPADVRRLLGDPPEAAAMPPEATPPGAQGVVRRWPRPGGWGPRAAVQRWAWAAALVGAL